MMKNSLLTFTLFFGVPGLGHAETPQVLLTSVKNSLASTRRALGAQQGRIARDTAQGALDSVNTVLSSICPKDPALATIQQDLTGILATVKGHPAPEVFSQARAEIRNDIQSVAESSCWSRFFAAPVDGDTSQTLLDATYASSVLSESSLQIGAYRKARENAINGLDSLQKILVSSCADDSNLLKANDELLSIAQNARKKSDASLLNGLQENLDSAEGHLKNSDCWKNNFPTGQFRLAKGVNYFWYDRSRDYATTPNYGNLYTQQLVLRNLGNSNLRFESVSIRLVDGRTLVSSGDALRPKNTSTFSLTDETHPNGGIIAEIDLNKGRVDYHEEYVCTTVQVFEGYDGSGFPIYDTEQDCDWEDDTQSAFEFISVH